MATDISTKKNHLNFKNEIEANQKKYEKLIDEAADEISNFVEKAHYTSLNFNEDQSEFDYCNLESFYIDNYSPPFVKESKVKIGLKLHEIIPIKSNGCKFIIGEVEHILIDDSIHLINEGSINLDESNSVGVGGLNSYYTMNKIAELPFPRLSTTPASEMNKFWEKKF